MKSKPKNEPWTRFSILLYLYLFDVPIVINSAQTNVIKF